jgi:hypothetical protein
MKPLDVALKHLELQMQLEQEINKRIKEAEARGAKVTRIQDAIYIEEQHESKNDKADSLPEDSESDEGREGKN